MVQKQALTGGFREGPRGGSLFYWAGAFAAALGWNWAVDPNCRGPPPKTPGEGKTKAFFRLCRTFETMWVNPPLLERSLSSASSISISAHATNSYHIRRSVSPSRSLPDFVSVHVGRGGWQPAASSQSHFPL